MEIRLVAVAGHRLRVFTSEGRRGSLPLLVFNGLGADLDVMRGLARELATLGIGIVIFDVPGIGGSSIPNVPYRLPWLANVAHEVLRALGIDGPVDVAGMSWGGALAQEFARRYPRRVRRLVLAATSAGTVAVPGRWWTLAHLLDPRNLTGADPLARIGGALYGGKVRGNGDSLQHLGRFPRPIGYSLQLMAITGWTSAVWLHTLRQPTLVMMGTDDPIVPLANGRILASLIPNARLVTLADGHLFLLSSAGESATIIARFLIDGEWPATRGAAAPATPAVNGKSADAGVRRTA